VKIKYIPRYNYSFHYVFKKIGIRMPTEIGIDVEQDRNTKDFTNVRGVHRFRNHMIAAKLSKNLCSPTAMLHVANLPEGYNGEDLQKYLVEAG
jgi:hypothetical protein